LKHEPENAVIEQRIKARSKGEIIDFILRCRDKLDKCTRVISSPFSSDSRLSYYKKKYQRVLNRCHVAGNVLIEKIGDEPTANTIIYLSIRHPEIFEEFIKDKYFKPAWAPVLHAMIEKSYLSKEDVSIMNMLQMMKKYVLYISAGE